MGEHLVIGGAFIPPSGGVSRGSVRVGGETFLLPFYGFSFGYKRKGVNIASVTGSERWIVGTTSVQVLFLHFFLSFRQPLRVCHLPRQRKVIRRWRFALHCLCAQFRIILWCETSLTASTYTQSPTRSANVPDLKARPLSSCAGDGCSHRRSYRRRCSFHPKCAPESAFFPWRFRHCA